MSRIALTVSSTAAVLAFLGYTPAAAPDVHGIMAGMSVYLANRARERG